MTARAGKSLRAFAKERHYTKCKVCALPEDVRKQIRGRPRREVRLDVALRWVKEVHQVNISEAEYMVHARGGHERRKV